MPKLIEIFEPNNAKSDAFEKYSSGDVAFVTNGDYESSILGYVTPFDEDRVFTKKGICLSSFGEATIQEPPFLPRGNGGSGLLVLLPRKNMTDEELYSYAAQINLQKWRFSFSRMAIQRRITNIELKRYVPKYSIKNKRVSIFSTKQIIKQNIEKKELQIDKLSKYCNIFKKTALPQNQLESGLIPYVSTSSKNNGISDLVDEDPNFKGKCLTVALNGSVGEVFFQFDDFITSGDNAVLTLKEKYNPHLLFYIGAMIKNHQWRYNYYRKLNLTKLKKMQLAIPLKNGEVDLEYIEKIVKNSYGYNEVKRFL